jgi:hypothetical protein
MLSNRKGLRTHLTLLFSLIALILVAGAPATAEEAQSCRGEPTDPEKMLVVASANADDLEQEGITLTPPAAEDAFDAWYRALIEALIALGLLPPETTP